ncbi:hypothetical protein VTK56DRAFT_6168 [Thermocarpiscus australiensis]
MGKVQMILWLEQHRGVNFHNTMNRMIHPLKAHIAVYLSRIPHPEKKASQSQSNPSPSNPSIPSTPAAASPASSSSSGDSDSDSDCACPDARTASILLPSQLHQQPVAGP